MGKVVPLEGSGDGKGQGRPRNRRRRRSKTALVLLAVNRTVNEFDVYVGTSAGAFIASLTANGITPEEMMRVLNRRLPSPIKELDLGTLLKPNYRGFVTRGVVFPL